MKTYVLFHNHCVEYAGNDYEMAIDKGVALNDGKSNVTLQEWEDGHCIRIYTENEEILGYTTR